jgi:hypothetical protein
VLPDAGGVGDENLAENEEDFVVASRRQSEWIIEVSWRESTQMYKRHGLETRATVWLRTRRWFF